MFNTVSAQSAAENIRPVGQVCLQGQPCVGTTGSAGSSASVPADPAPAAATAETVAEPAATQEPAADQAPAAAPAAATTAAADDFDAAATYQMSCFACHGTGAAGAPQPGDAEVWEERMAKGMDAVMANVINGVNAMPARGICMSCSDEQLRQVVDYMLAQ
jgi:cytochrome c5